MRTHLLIAALLIMALFAVVPIGTTVQARAVQPQSTQTLLTWKQQSSGTSPARSSAFYSQWQFKARCSGGHQALLHLWDNLPTGAVLLNSWPLRCNGQVLRVNEYSLQLDSISWSVQQGRGATLYLTAWGQCDIYC